MADPELSWDDLRLFLDVARLGGLSAASRKSGLSPATLGRRVTALERQIGSPLFTRQQTGYTLTRTGEDLLGHAEEVEAAMRGLLNWRDGRGGETVVRISAGHWTARFLARHITALWRVEDRVQLDFVTATAKLDIGRRAADIGIRSMRPTEPNLAGRQIGRVAHGLYAGRSLSVEIDGKTRPSGVAAGIFVGVSGEAASVASARWLMAHHGDRIVLRANDPYTVRELVANNSGLGLFPCFVGDEDKRLVRAAPVIAELETEQWLVMHHEDRHRPEVRLIAERIGQMMAEHGALFRGERPLD